MVGRTAVRRKITHNASFERQNSLLPAPPIHKIRKKTKGKHTSVLPLNQLGVVMILPQVHLRKPCYDFTFL